MKHTKVLNYHKINEEVKNSELNSKKREIFRHNNDTKFTYYYGSYNHKVHYQPYMEFDMKDMRRIVDENGELTNILENKSEWERITQFVLNTDRKRFDFYLTLMNLGLISKATKSFKKAK